MISTEIFFHISAQELRKSLLIIVKVHVYYEEEKNVVSAPNLLTFIITS